MKPDDAVQEATSVESEQPAPVGQAHKPLPPLPHTLATGLSKEVCGVVTETVGTAPPVALPKGDATSSVGVSESAEKSAATSARADNPKKEQGVSASFVSRAQSIAGKAWSEICRGARLAALKAGIWNQKRSNLTQAHYALGKKCYELGLYKDKLAAAVAAIQDRKKLIKEKSASKSAVPSESTTQKAKRVFFNVLGKAEAMAMIPKLKSLFTDLGELVPVATEPDALNLEREAVHEVERRVEVLNEEYKRLSEKAGFAVSMASKRGALVLISTLLLLVWIVALVKMPNEGKANVSDGEANPNLVSSDPYDSVSVTVLRVLLGEEIFNRRGSDTYRLSEIRKKGNNLVLFELVVENKTNEKKGASVSYFKLTTESGLTYPYYSALGGALWIDLLPSEKGRIDVAFEFPKDSNPKTLVFDAGWRKKSGADVVVFTELSSIALFKSKHTTPTSAESEASEYRNQLIESAEAYASNSAVHVTRSEIVDIVDEVINKQKASENKKQ